MAIIFIEYLYWHLAVAPGTIIRIMMNYMHAMWRRFLVVQHLRTLFSPWRRRQPSDLVQARTQGIGEKIVGVFIDGYIRVLAACLRLVVIVAGLCVQIVVATGFILALFLWVFWPLIALYLFGRGIFIVMAI